MERCKEGLRGSEAWKQKSMWAKLGRSGAVGNVVLEDQNSWIVQGNNNDTSDKLGENVRD